MSLKSMTLFRSVQISETVLIDPSFNEFGILNKFCICVNVCEGVLINFKFVNMFVFNTNELVNYS
jgi:hypothetical protein